MADKLDSNGNQTKYEGFPFITNIDKYVQNELANRSLERIRPVVPFVKVTPGFSLDGTPAGKIVLKGIEAPNYKDPATYQFKDLYRPDSFFRPLAGVKSINVDYKNAYGSIKKVVINWVCHTLEDLERLSPYFLNPGQSMFVEWGWSNYASSVIDNNPDINLAAYLGYVREKRKLSNGNYDGMLGIVVNYSFVLNRDGGFDCTTEVVSSGYVMEGITMSNQITQDANGSNSVLSAEESAKESNEDTETDKTKEETPELKVLQTLQNFLENDFFTKIKTDSKDPKFTNPNTKDDYFILDDAGKNSITQVVDSNTGRTHKETVSKTFSVGSQRSGIKTVEVEIPLRVSTYASWGYLEDFILNEYLKVESSTEKVLFEFDSRGSKICSHQNLRTTDLGFVIVPIANTPDAPKVPDFKNNETVDNSLEFGYVRRLLINVEFFRQSMLNATTINDAVLKLFSQINDVCINYWTFRLVPNEEKFDDILEREGTKVSDSLKSAVNTISGTPSLGINSEGNSQFTNKVRKPGIISQRIVDLNYSDRVFEQVDLKNGLYMFRTKTFSIEDENGKIIPNVTSVVRNLTFQSKLSSQAALNVFYSAQNKDGRIMGSPSNNTFQSLYDFSINGIKYSKAKDTFSAGPYQATGPDIDANKRYDKQITDPGTTTEPYIVAQHAYGDALTRFLPWGPEPDQENKSVGGKGYWVTIENKKTGKKINLTGKEGMKMAVLVSPDGKSLPATSEALVPLECEVELEGISGIKIGDIFTIDHIPKIYQNHGTFQVIGITDTIDKNSWVTKLKAGFRVFKDKVQYTSIKNAISKISSTPTTTGGTPYVFLDTATTWEANILAKQIQFKTNNEREEFVELNTKNPSLRDILIKTNAYSVTKFNVPITITSLYRTQQEQEALNPAVEMSKHTLWKAADLRSSVYTPSQIEELKKYIRSLGATVLYHTVSGNSYHFHVQV